MTTTTPTDGENAADDLAAVVASIDAQLSAAATPELWERIAAARRRWPQVLRLILLQGSWLEKAARPEEAQACFREALAAHPENPWPAIRLIESLLAQRRAGEAAQIFGASLWMSAAPEELRGRLLGRVVTALVDLGERRKFLESLLRGSATDRLVLPKLAALCMRQRDRATAERLFDQARQYGPLPLESQALALELLITATRFDEAFELAMDLRARHPERSEYARRAIQAAHFSGRTEQMIELLRDALTRWPGDWALAFRYNRCTCPMAADRELFELMSAEAATADDDRWRFQYVVACLRHERIDEALRVLGRMQADSPAAPMALPLRDALCAYPSSTWISGRGAVNDPHRDVQVLRVAGARATMILLAGVQGGLGYLPVSAADGLMARIPVNVVYLRDLANRGFTAGVHSLGPDQASMLAGLTRICAPLGVPVVTFGASIGGVAAIRTALGLGAHAAISFAGPVHLGVDSAEDVPDAGGGARATIFSRFAHTDLSLIELIRAAPRTRIHQCYGTGFPPDVADAELLRPLPNATLYPVARCADHFVIEHMIADGSFFEVIERAISMPALDAAL